jgi:hypothetical protein
MTRLIHRMNQPTIARIRRGGRRSPRTPPSRKVRARKVRARKVRANGVPASTTPASLSSPTQRPLGPGLARCSRHPFITTREPGRGRCRRHPGPLRVPGRGPPSPPSVTPRPVHRREWGLLALHRLGLHRLALCRRALRLVALRPGEHRGAEARADGRRTGPGTRAVRHLPPARVTCRRPMRRGVPRSRRRPVTRRRRGSRSPRTCKPPGSLRPCRRRRRRIRRRYRPYRGPSGSRSRAWRGPAR